jgi:hypothetical protein
VVLPRAFERLGAIATFPALKVMSTDRLIEWSRQRLLFAHQAMRIVVTIATSITQ